MQQLAAELRYEDAGFRDVGVDSAIYAARPSAPGTSGFITFYQKSRKLPLGAARGLLLRKLRCPADHDVSVLHVGISRRIFAADGGAKDDFVYAVRGWGVL